MSDYQALPEFTDISEPVRSPNDITHQVTRLARAIDRLPPGDYVIHLEKGDRQETWRALILFEEREVIRVMDLWR